MMAQFTLSQKNRMISVILPVYNGEKTIREAVESVLDQTCADFELIVINDGSTDSTIKILTEIEDPRLKVYSFPNSGLATSRNRGKSIAMGEYIAFIDADDLWMPGKLQAQLGSLHQNPEAAVSYCWVNYIDNDGNFVCPDNRVNINGNVYQTILIENFIHSGSTIMARRKAIESIGGFDESLPAVEDWDLYIRLAANYPFVCVPEPHVLYRLTPGALSTNVILMENSFLKVVNRAFDHAPKSFVHLKNRSIANFYVYLTSKATQGFPDKKSGLNAMRFFRMAAENNPVLLWQIWHNPRLLKALVKALLGVISMK